MRPPHPRRAPSCTRAAHGVRFAFNPQHGGSLDLTVFNHVVRCIAPLGWFVELHFDGADIARLQEWLEAIPVQVVIDHLGRVDPAGGVAQEPFQILLALLARGNFWIKLSGADRISRQGAPYADVAPLAQALVSARPDRLLWGTDWPHTGYFDAARVPETPRWWMPWPPSFPRRRSGKLSWSTTRCACWHWRPESRLHALRRSSALTSPSTGGGWKAASGGAPCAPH
jgi:predicted TIM-barrel fold metal-dependent hydrolase